MEMVRIFGLPAALLVLAFVANRLSKLTRVPDIIVLLLIGVTLGPILRWVNPDTFKGAVHVLGMLALILILFEGGLELRLRQALRYFPAGLLLVALSFGLSLGLIALIGHALSASGLELLPADGRRIGMHQWNHRHSGVAADHCARARQDHAHHRSCSGRSDCRADGRQHAEHGTEPVHAHWHGRETFPTTLWLRWLWESRSARRGRGCGQWLPVCLTAIF